MSPTSSPCRRSARARPAASPGCSVGGGPAWALKHNPYWPAWWLAEGLALLSHHRLAVHPPVVLTPEINRRTFRRRILLPAEVLLEDDQRVLVIDAHLSSGDDDGLRVREAHHILSILPDSLPTVFVGDLNATPRAESIKVLIDGGFVDVWPAAAPAGEPGFTFPANAPRRRIDYVMVERRRGGRRGVGAGRPRRGDERPVRPSPVARPARAAGTVAGLACGGDQRHPRRRPARLRAGRRDRAAGRRRRGATQPGRPASCTPATTCPRTCSTGLRHAGRVLLDADGGQAALRRRRARHGQTGYTGLLVETAATSRRARLEGDAQLGPRGARRAIRCAPRYPHRYGPQVLPEAAVPGITKVLNAVPRPHRRPAAALPAHHRRGHRLPRDVLRRDAPPRPAPHPGHPLPGHGPGARTTGTCGRARTATST